MLIDHPQFSRATVNWIWSELMVVGIVDPPHDFDLLRPGPRESSTRALDDSADASRIAQRSGRGLSQTTTLTFGT